MPLIPQQHFVTAFGSGADCVAEALKKFNEEMDKLPPVRIVTLDANHGGIPIREDLVMSTVTFLAVVEEV